jgi:hypothetical protein
MKRTDSLFNHQEAGHHKHNNQQRVTAMKRDDIGTATKDREEEGRTRK